MDRLLQQHFGYEELRPGQRQIITALLQGNNVIGLMPTGEGKSICFQLPTLYMNWKTLVFSPLLSLMQDQVLTLKRKNIKAEMINSLQKDKDNERIVEQWRAGELNFLYTAPEKLYNSDFKRMIYKHRPDLIVIDEAHCISRWGKDFRTAYMRLEEFIKNMRCLCICLTATATGTIIQDIEKVCKYNDYNTEKIIYYPERENLHYKTVEVNNPIYELFKILRYDNKPTIIYTNTTVQVDRLAAELALKLNKKIAYYHGQLHSKEKFFNQESFMSGELDVCVATNAFGMGVDKANIRRIIHLDYPLTVEDYVQETGRAGRDGKDADCILLKSKSRLSTQMYFIENKNPEPYVFEYLLNELLKNKDDKMQVRRTVKELANYSIGATEEKISTALNIMQGFDIIKKWKDKNRQFKIKLLNGYTDKYIDVMKNSGFLLNDYYLVQMEEIANKLEVKETTVIANFGKLENLGKVEIIRPYRGNIINVISTDLDRIDFDFIARKKDIEIELFNKMIRFADLPDCDKKRYLREYFNFAGDNKIDERNRLMNVLSQWNEKFKKLVF